MGRVKKKRVLHLAVSLQEGDGGIASVSRAMISAMESWTEVRCDIRMLELRSGKFRFIIDFILALIEHRPELIVVDHLHLSPLAYLTRWFHRTPYVLFCHGKEMDEQVTWLRRFSLQAATIRIANSNFTAQRLTQKFGLTFRVSLLGLDPLLERARAKSKIRTNSVILVVGRMDPGERYKGHDQLIAALAEIKKAVPDAKLVIVGGGNDLERLKSLTRTMHLEGSVHFTGWVTTQELAEHFAQCAVFAMPSKNEGFGLTYIEAMRFGKPVIGSMLDGAVDVVEDGVSGFLVDPDDIATLAQKLIELLKDPKKAQSMGEAGRLRYETLFTHAAFARRFQSVISSILLERKVRRRDSKEEAA